jgi:hypothetical protein
VSGKADVQIRETIPVEVTPRRSACVLQVGDSGCLRHIDEGAVAPVAVKAIRAIPETDEDIEMSIPIEVSHRDRLGTGGRKQLRLDRLEHRHLANQRRGRRKR